MNDLAEWIATHALPVWAALLMAALVVGDVAWQWNRRHGRKSVAAGGQPVAVRGVTAALLLLSMGLLFAAIAVALKEEATRWLPAFDQSLAQDLHASMQPGVLRLVAAVSHAGDLGSVAAASVLVLAVLLLRRHVRLATCWAVAMAGIVPINSGLKAMFQRPRPLDGYMIEHGWSFPSGHAFGAIVFYGNPDFYSGYDSKDVQTLIADSGAAATTDEQTADLKKANEIIANDAASDWLYLYPQIVVSSAKVTGYPVNGLNSQFFVYGIKKAK